jgi:hypothetical protein
VKFLSVVSIQVFSLKNANPSFYEIHVENDYFPLPSKFEMRYLKKMGSPEVTIRNMDSNLILDEFVEPFAGRAIYSMGYLYLSYDQFQLAVENKDLTTLQMPLGLLRMCKIPQRATNSFAHLMNTMNKVLRDFIPEKIMSFLDNVPIKGCIEEEKDETLDSKGCWKFVADCIVD